MAGNAMNAATLQPWIDAGVLGPTEVHAAAVVADLVGPEPGVDEVVLAVALAVWAPQHGHSCIELDDVAEIVAAEQAIVAADTGDETAAGAVPLPWPEVGAWLSGVAGERVRPGGRGDRRGRRPRRATDRPLRSPRVHAAPVGRRVCRGRSGASPCRAKRCTDDVDGGARRPAAATDRRRRERSAHGCDDGGGIAAHRDRRRTGHWEDAHRCQLPRRRAGRICSDPHRSGGAHRQGGESALRRRRRHRRAGRRHRPARRRTGARLGCLRASTVHRLLGPRPDHRTRFRHDEDDPLELDLLVVDESSMLALPLAARLLAAVPDDCRLVLVGDPDQLHSIEVGTVLADLVDAGQPNGALGDRVVRLVTQHRTGAGSPIGPARRGDPSRRRRWRHRPVASRR